MGNTSVQQSTYYESRLRGGFDPASPTSGNYNAPLVEASGAMGGRSSGGSLFPSARAGASHFMSGFGANSFIQPYAQAAPNGREAFTNYRGRPAVPMTARNLFMFHHVITAIQEGGTAPASPAYEKQIKDELAELSLSNAPSAEGRLQDHPERRSYAEILSGRITAERDRCLREGWELYHAERFVHAVLRFEAAETADRASATARVGIFAAALADGSMALAEASLQRIMRNDPQVFTLDMDLKSKAANPEVFEDTVNWLGAASRQHPKDPGLAGINGFYLWFLGRRDEALRVADQIHQEHRASSFASMAARMRGEAETEGLDTVRLGRSVLN